MKQLKPEDKNTEDYSKMVNGNTILLSLEGWIKYIEGFTRGLQSTDKVSSSSVLDCIGEIMEYMTGFKTQLISLFSYCEKILEENERLKKLQEEQYLLTTKDPKTIEDNILEEQLDGKDM